MRVTQSMLSNNMLRNLNTSYGKMSKYQEMLNSGKQINRPSEDPVIAVKGMGYRVDLEKSVQYQRNMREAHTWLDSTDESLDQVGNVLIRVKELIVQAANDTNKTDDRKKILQEISQLKEHVQDLGNTKVGENYIFSGTLTNRPLFADGTLNPDLPAEPPLPEEWALNKTIEINVFDGISMQINTKGVDLFGKINDFMIRIEGVLGSAATSAEISDTLGFEIGTTTPAIPGLDKIVEQTLETRGTVGAKQNRVELMENRLKVQEINVTKQMSLNEDTDYAKTITDMTTTGSIHQAALSVGAKIIQQTLVDFIR